jgi:hypothetical protein
MTDTCGEQLVVVAPTNNTGSQEDSVGSCTSSGLLCKIQDPSSSSASSRAAAVAPAAPESSTETNIWQTIRDDFDASKGGDYKILRAIGRTATVNAAVAVTAMTAGAATPLVGFATGGAITAKRLGEGIQHRDSQEVIKSLAVYGSATTASIVGQVATGAILMGAAGVAAPLAATIAFGVGCVSGIAAGATSEWVVEKGYAKAEEIWSTAIDHLVRKLTGRAVHKSMVEIMGEHSAALLKLH